MFKLLWLLMLFIPGLLFMLIPPVLGWANKRFMVWNKRDIASIKRRNRQSAEQYTEEHYNIQFYEQTKLLFCQKMKSKSMTRSNVLEFKKILNDCLASYSKNYRREFKNDAHEIYVKLKDIHLDESDFETMNTYLNKL